MLETVKVNNLDIFTPTKWQTVILRNYGLVETKNIAKILKCTARRVEIEAARLGIDKIQYSSLWREKSYLTIIRNNWNLLNYEQLLDLLEMILKYYLKHQDVLIVKIRSASKDVR